MIYKNATRYTTLFLLVTSCIYTGTINAVHLLHDDIEHLGKMIDAKGADIKKSTLEGIDRLSDGIADKSGKKLQGVTDNFMSDLRKLVEDTLKKVREESNRIPDLTAEAIHRGVPGIACGLGACTGIILMYQSFNEIVKLSTVDQSLPEDLQTTTNPKQLEREEIMRKARWRSAIIRGTSGLIIAIACITTNSFVKPTHDHPAQTLSLNAAPTPPISPITTPVARSAPKPTPPTSTKSPPEQPFYRAHTI